MNDSTEEPVTYERLQSIYIYASILMNKILTAMLITDYANKTRLKPVLFSNIVHMILSVYALDEESFKEHLHLHNEQNVAHLQITGKPITSEDINNSSVKMFPMMIKIDDGSWVESEDIKISERDKFLWWWVDYLCYSVDIKKINLISFKQYQLVQCCRRRMLPNSLRLIKSFFLQL